MSILLKVNPIERVFDETYLFGSIIEFLGVNNSNSFALTSKICNKHVLTSCIKIRNIIINDDKVAFLVYFPKIEVWIDYMDSYKITKESLLELLFSNNCFKIIQHFVDQNDLYDLLILDSDLSGLMMSARYGNTTFWDYFWDFDNEGIAVEVVHAGKYGQYSFIRWLIETEGNDLPENAIRRIVYEHLVSDDRHGITNEGMNQVLIQLASWIPDLFQSDLINLCLALKAFDFLKLLLSNYPTANTWDNSSMSHLLSFVPDLGIISEDISDSDSIDFESLNFARYIRIESSPTCPWDFDDYHLALEAIRDNPDLLQHQRNYLLDWINSENIPTYNHQKNLLSFDNLAI
jgi:hypothetical protein